MSAPGAVTDWIVGLRGDKWVLEALESTFASGEPRVVRRESRVTLHSATFLQFSDGLDVLNAANPLLAEMCGLLNILANVQGKAEAVSAMWVLRDGRRGGVGDTATFTAHMVDRAELERLASTLDGGTLAADLLTHCQTDPALVSALKLAGSHFLSLPDLYFIYEALESACGGQKQLARLSGVSNAALRRFTGTANMFRHPTAPRRRFVPMSYPDALRLIRALFKAWTRYVHDRPSNPSLQRTSPGRSPGFGR